MFRIVASGLSIFLLIVFLTGLYIHEEFFNIGSRHQKPSSRSVAEEESKVDIKIRASIIKVVLEGMTKKDHAVTADGRVYLMISEDLYGELPKEVKGIKIERYSSSVLPPRNSVPLIVFKGWAMEANSIRVTQIAHFVGGNTGGCDERYTFWEVEGWKRSNSECFATAS